MSDEDKIIELMPVAATREVMVELEEMGCIIRLAPGRHEISTEPGQAIGKPVSQADAVHGGHLLLACTIHQAGFKRFGWHEVPEEFLLIGDSTCEPLYLAIFQGDCTSLQQKINDDTLSAGDFKCLRLVFNDPECSFFTMNAGIPHGECIAREIGRPPSFYVAEPSGTKLIKPQWGGYQLALTCQ